MSAPTVPAEFWRYPEVAKALDSWHMGKVVRAYRLHPWHGTPLHQATVAAWVHLTQTQLSRIENGAAITDLHKLIRWANVLSIPADLLWFKMPRTDATSSSTRPRRQPHIKLINDKFSESITNLSAAPRPTVALSEGGKRQVATGGVDLWKLNEALRSEQPGERGLTLY